MREQKEHFRNGLKSLTVQPIWEAFLDVLKLGHQAVWKAKGWLTGLYTVDSPLTVK